MEESSGETLAPEGESNTKPASKQQNSNSSTAEHNSNNNKNNVMNELLFATLLSMVAHRMTGSFVAIPFLWFILGLSLGVSKLQFSSHQS